VHNSTNFLSLFTSFQFNNVSTKHKILCFLIVLSHPTQWNFHDHNIADSITRQRRGVRERKWHLMLCYFCKYILCCCLYETTLNSTQLRWKNFPSIVSSFSFHRVRLVDQLFHCPSMNTFIKNGIVINFAHLSKRGISYA
jgi:hypothetical protein